MKLIDIYIGSRFLKCFLMVIQAPAPAHNAGQGRVMDCHDAEEAPCPDLFQDGLKLF